MLDEVTWDGRTVAGERTRALLRALVDAGPRGCTENALIDAIWGEDLPDNPSKSLHVVVSRSRTATETDVIERTPRGYRLALDSSEVDAWSLRPDALRLTAEGKYEQALPLLEQLERLEQDDVMVEALIRCIAAVHGTTTALTRYEDHRRRLANSLGIDPSPQLQALHGELLSRDQPVRSGVRFDADRLIGRDSDIAALEVLVRTHRLTSIVGAGGLGKTRMAHAVARTAEQPIVHFVELAAVTSPEGVGVEVADALGVRETVSNRPQAFRNADLIARIVDAVGTVRSLLVLDNCEHLVDAVADLVSTLLSRTPALTILTTTRIPLDLAAEYVYLLPELSLSDGVELFVERAKSARPDVTLDDSEVHDLVARLDGLPLAVELAAAKARVMSVAEIARRLENRFALLRGGSRDAPTRHQTLLAVIDWSWNLLTEPERVALRRLSVFRDGFSLSGATAVIGTEALGEGDLDALEIVGSLVNQSLIVVREDAEIRYRLLETVREFGRMQLVDAGDDKEAQANFVSWAVGFARTVHSELFTPRQVEMMTLIRREEANLVDVLRSCLAAEDRGSTAEIFAVLSSFWTIEGTHLKVFNVGPAVEQLLVGEPTPPELADAVRSSLTLLVITNTMFRGNEDSAGWKRLNELGPGDDPRNSATIRVLLGVGPDGVLQGLPKLTAFADDPDPHVARVAMMWCALAYENEGDLPTALRMSRRALELCDDEEGPWMRAMLRAQLSRFELSSGDYVSARTHALEAIPLLKALGAIEDYTQTRVALALIALHTGQIEEADRLIEEISRSDVDQSIFGAALSLYCGKAELHLARGEIRAGLEVYANAIDEMRVRVVPIPDWPTDFTPWIIIPQAAFLTAICRFAEAEPEFAAKALGQRNELLEAGLVITGKASVVDFPVLGSVIFSLAAWEATYGDADAAARLLAYAKQCEFTRMFPVFDWQWATSLVEPANVAHSQDRLRQDLHATLRRLKVPAG